MHLQVFCEHMHWSVCHVHCQPCNCMPVMPTASTCTGLSVMSTRSHVLGCLSWLLRAHALVCLSCPLPAMYLYACHASCEHMHWSVCHTHSQHTLARSSGVAPYIKLYMLFLHIIRYAYLLRAHTCMYFRRRSIYKTLYVASSHHYIRTLTESTHLYVLQASLQNSSLLVYTPRKFPPLIPILYP